MKDSISKNWKAISEAPYRSISEWCFPSLEVRAANDRIHNNRRQGSDDFDLETNLWEDQLASQEDAVEIVRDLYQSEIAAITRLEDKLQSYTSVILVLFPIIVTAASTLVNGLADSPRSPAAWFSVLAALGALIQLWSAYKLAGQGHSVRTRWQADVSSIKEALRGGKNAYIHIAAIEAVSTELNSGTILILGNLIQGTRMTLTRVIVLVSLGIAIYLIWVLGVSPQEIACTHAMDAGIWLR